MRTHLISFIALYIHCDAVSPFHFPSFSGSGSTSSFEHASYRHGSDDFLHGYDWVPAALIANASRSPCPMLNTLANHGFLPRNGRNITKENFNDAQVRALNTSPDLATKTTNAMSAKLGSPKNASSTFDLEDFAAHDRTEHDASLTRLDIIQGPVNYVDPGLVRLLLQDSSLPWLNTSSIGRSRARREAESKYIGSPKLSEAFTAFAQLEASFIVLIFGVGEGEDVNTWGAPKAQLKTWLNEERFPVEEGYVRSDQIKTREMQEDIIAGIRKFHDQYTSEYP